MTKKPHKPQLDISADPLEWMKPFMQTQPMCVTIGGVQPDEFAAHVEVLRKCGADVADTLLRGRLLNPDIEHGRKLDSRKAGRANTGKRRSRYAAEYPAWYEALAAERIEHPEKAVIKFVPAIRKRTGTKASDDTIRRWLAQEELKKPH